LDTFYLCKFVREVNLYTAAVEKEIGRVKPDFSMKRYLKVEKEVE